MDWCLGRLGCAQGRNGGRCGFFCCCCLLLLLLPSALSTSVDSSMVVMSALPESVGGVAFRYGMHRIQVFLLTVRTRACSLGAALYDVLCSAQ